MNCFMKCALMLVSTSALALSSVTGAFAEESVAGRVYQIEPSNVYVEAGDHTAVKVPISSAIFTVRGVRTEVAGLRIGMPVEAVYTPDNMMEPYDVIFVAPKTVNRVYLREYREEGRLIREYRENGDSVNYLWYNGRWHRK